MSGQKPWFVYLLVAEDGATYVGATVDLEHRLRQHNGQIGGGAKATHVRVAVEEPESGERPPGPRASGAPPRGPPAASGAGPTDDKGGPLFVVRRGCATNSL